MTVFDKLRDSIKEVESALIEQGFTAPASVDLPSGRKLTFKKTTGGWGLRVVHNDEEAPGTLLIDASLSDRLDAIDELPLLYTLLYQARAEQNERIQRAVRDATDFVANLRRKRRAHED